MASIADNIVTALRPLAPEQKFKQAEVDLINQIADLWRIRLEAIAAASAVKVGPTIPWVEVAKTKLGQKEVPGPAHNTWISKGWALLGAGWYYTDETPWCGFFIAWCMERCGLPYPGRGSFAAAAAWRSWGRSVIPQYGAIGVKARTGGNHVFIITGITADKRYYKALGGNQRNMVSEIDIPIGAVTSIRWPATVADPKIPLPIRAKGTITTDRDEA